MTPSDGQGVLMVLPASALASRRLSKKHGHAALPGTGPSRETCGTCEHITWRRMARGYIKCSLMRLHWTREERTDVRKKDPACRRWAAQTSG